MAVEGWNSLVLTSTLSSNAERAFLFTFNYKHDSRQTRNVLFLYTDSFKAIVSSVVLGNFFAFSLFFLSSRHPLIDSLAL